MLYKHSTSFPIHVEQIIIDNFIHVHACDLWIQILQSDIKLLGAQKESLAWSITVLLQWFIVEARWSMNIATHDSWIQISVFTKQANWTRSCIERKQCYSKTIQLDGFVVMYSNKPGISYKPEVYMLHIPTHSQVYMCKYRPGGTYLWCMVSP